MKKKLLVGVLLLSGLLGIGTFYAANNSIKIMSENDSVKQLASDGTNILNTINTEKSDLANGKVAIDIIIDNSKKVEVFYVIDNSSSMSSIKGNVIDTLKSNAEILETRNNITQGVVYTTSGTTTTKQLDNKNIGNNLNEVKTSTSSTLSGEIFDSLAQAVNSFTSNEGVKVVVLVVNDLGSLTTDQVNAYKTVIDSYSSKGIQIIAYDIDMADKTNFNTIFSTSTRKDVVSTDLTALNSTQLISTLLPSAKNNAATSVSFDTYILNNFDIVEVTSTKGTASYDSNSKLVNWTIPTIESNEKVVLSYYLKIKDVVDSNVVEKVTMRTNRQIKVTINGSLAGTYPSDAQIDDQVCSPTIVVLKEKLSNPQTGIAEYIIAGACMLAVGLVTLVIMYSKNEFNRI